MLRSWLAITVTGVGLATPASALPWPPECKGPLVPSVQGSCSGVSHAGCCDPRGRVLYCTNNDLYCVDCAGQLPECGWTPFGHYDCGTNGGSDPTGVHAATCPAACDPSCTPSSPCSATCPGSCGHCAGGRACLEDGQCHHPDCGDRECGVDADGLSCGLCPHGTLCVEPLFACLPLPSGCAAKRGPGLALRSLGEAGCEDCVCAKYPTCCQWNWDAFCAAACEQECGQDCTACPASPKCAPGQCGPFCGLDCGGCPEGQNCHASTCCSPDCQNDDGSPRPCGPDGCGGSCGACENTYSCIDGACVPCQPACAGKQCGPDGCGGSCGDCAPPATCDDAGACLSPGSCWSVCGGQSDACYCDPVCQSYGDCCPDFCDACPVECATDPCEGVPAVGCCQGEALFQCVQGQPQATDCTATPFCGWNGTAGQYQCGTDGGTSKAHPKACPVGAAAPPGASSALGKKAVEPPAATTMPIAQPIENTTDRLLAFLPGGGPPGPQTALVPPVDGMGVPAVALLLSLLLALLGCSGDGGNERRDSGGPETVADVPTDVALDPGLDPGTDPGPVEADTDAPDLPDVPAPSDGEGAEPPDVPAEAETTPEIVDGAGETETTLPFNCQHLPLGPLDLEKVEGTIAAEDLAFDGEGYLIGSDMSAVYKSAPGKATKIFVPNLQTRAGMRMTPAGFLAVNDDTQGRLLLYRPDGTLDRVLMQGLAYPNGMVVDLDGYVLITEHNSGRVLRVHPYTGESTVLAEGLEYPNGIVFDATYTRLYVGTFGGAKIWTFTLSRDGRPGRVEVFADLSDTPGQLDGMGVDACGNVYVCEYGSADIWRIAPDGKTKVRIIDSDPDVTYLPNLQWGRGEGWDPRSIYVPDGWNVGVWRVQVGVPSAPLPFP